MNKFKSIAVTLILLLNITLNNSQAKSKTKKVKSATAGKIHVPKTINGFNLSQTKKYKKVKLGVAFKYANDKLPQVNFDYYIYPMYDQISIEDMMITEYQNNINVIKTVSEKDDGIVSTLHQELITVNDQQIIKATINIDNEIGTFISELYLTSVRGHFVKARISYPMHDSKKFDLRNMVEDVFKRLLASTTFKSKKELEFNINIQADDFVSGNKNQLITSILYSAAVKSQSPQNFVYNFNNYYQMYDFLISVNYDDSDENEARKDGNEYIDYIDIYKAGFLREFIWVVYYRPYWAKPKDLKLELFQLWLDENNSKAFIKRPIGISILLKI
jgi:hypothetical protein